MSSVIYRRCQYSVTFRFLNCFLALDLCSLSKSNGFGNSYWTHRSCIVWTRTFDDHLPRKMAYHAEQGQLAEMQGKEPARKRRIKSVVQSWRCISFERVFVFFWYVGYVVGGTGPDDPEVFSSGGEGNLLAIDWYVQYMFRILDTLIILISQEGKDEVNWM